MNHIGLFEGIGGFSLAARWVGWETVAWCEWNEFGQKVLKHHFPKSEGFGDITKTDFTKYANRIDILTGGFPCQPFSVAGEQRGTDDHRYLWPEMFRAIREIQPRWVVAENVRGLVSWSDGLVFEQVCTDLESEGYEVFPVILPAAGVNAPHKRERIWFVAYNNGFRKEQLGYAKNKSRVSPVNTRVCNESWSTPNPNNQRNTAELGQVQGTDGEIPQRNDHAEFSDTGNKFVTDTKNTGLQARFEGPGQIKSRRGNVGMELPNYWQNFPTQSPVCNGNDGFCTESLRQRIREDSMGALSEKEIDKIFSEAASEWRKESIKAGGNAIVPQVAYQIFKAINQYENDPK